MLRFGSKRNQWLSSVELALKGLDVIIAPNKGWSSKTFVYNNLQRLKAELTQNPDRKVYVLYMGDSGFCWLGNGYEN